METSSFIFIQIVKNQLSVSSRNVHFRNEKCGKNCPFFYFHSITTNHSNIYLTEIASKLQLQIPHPGKAQIPTLWIAFCVKCPSTENGQMLRYPYARGRVGEVLRVEIDWHKSHLIHCKSPDLL